MASKNKNEPALDEKDMEVTPPEVTPPAPVAKDPNLELKTVIFPAGPGENGSDQFPFSVNGKAWQLTPGVPVKLPVYVLNALKLAVSTLYDGKMKARQVPRFPYTIVNE